MSLKCGTLGILVALCFCYVQIIQAGDHFDDNTCSYITICTRVITIHWRTIEKSGLCRKRESCEQIWGQWSECTRYCGGGLRRRRGRCVGENCEKNIKQIERCNPDPCPPPTTAAPPPPTTAAPPPPTTTAPPPTTTAPPPPTTTAPPPPTTTAPPPTTTAPPPPTTTAPPPTTTAPPPPTTTAPPPPTTTVPPPTTTAPPTSTSEPDIDGNWSDWSSWAETSCTVSCCGGTKSRSRSRTCTNPPPSGNGVTCPGNPMEMETGIVCNEDECPLSCSMVPVGTIFNEPCVVCSNTFRACAGADAPIVQTCPEGNFWSPMNNSCQTECDEVS